MALQELAVALDTLQSEFVIEHPRLLPISRILGQFGSLQLWEGLEDLQVVLVTLKDELLLILEGLNLFQDFHILLLFAIIFLRLLLTELSDLIRGNDVAEYFTKSSDSLQDNIDVSWILTEIQQIA